MAVKVTGVGVDVFIGKDDGAAREAGFDGVQGRFRFAFFGTGAGAVFGVGAVGIAAGFGGCFFIDFVDEVLEVEGVGWCWLVGAEPVKCGATNIRPTRASAAPACRCLKTDRTGHLALSE